MAHWLGYPTFFVGPAIVVATAGQKNPAVRKHAVEALNFQLSAFGAFALLGILTGVDPGVHRVPLPAARRPAGSSSPASAALPPLLGANFRYPFTLRLIK